MVEEQPDISRKDCFVNRFSEAEIEAPRAAVSNVGARKGRKEGILAFFF